MRHDLPVDAGMIGILPLAAVNRADGCWLEGGIVVKVAAGGSLSLDYDNGQITIEVGDHGDVAVDEDSEWWVGDPCYALENRLDEVEGDWSTAADPAPGYWAACVASMKVPRDGRFAAQPYRLDGGLLGLVASTRWGDGLYPITIRTRGDFLQVAVIETGDIEEEDDDADYDE